MSSISGIIVSFSLYSSAGFVGFEAIYANFGLKLTDSGEVCHCDSVFVVIPGGGMEAPPEMGIGGQFEFHGN